MALLTEMACQLLDGVDQARRLLVPSSRAQRAQLLQGGHEHYEPLERGHRQREVPLGDVQGLDVPADIADELLRLPGLCPDGLDALEQLAHGRLRLIEVRPGAPA